MAEREAFRLNEAVINALDRKKLASKQVELGHLAA